jgi:hypothetical protein
MCLSTEIPTIEDVIVEKLYYNTEEESIEPSAKI